MSEDSQTPGAAEGPDDGLALLYPLLPIDPPIVGDFWLDARLAASPSGIAYVAHDDTDTPVMLVMLSEGATADAAAVDRFAGTVNTMHIDTVIARGGRGQNEGRLAHRYRPTGDVPPTPDATPPASWVALAYTGRTDAVHEGQRILAAVDLSWLPPKGNPSGPAFALPWIDRINPGRTRSWPLPWPGRTDRAGWLSILLSWMLMMLLMALAILIAILLFQASPPQAPPPPVPTSASASPNSASPSPESGSPTPPQSPTPLPHSGSPSPQPSDTASANSPTPNSKL